MASIRPKNWTCVSYPSDYGSIDELYSFLESLQVPFYFMVHDADKDENGGLKPEHCHIVLEYGVNRTLQQVQSDLGSIAANGFVAPVRNLRSTVRYLCHKDNPKKAQYGVEKMCVGCGADALKYMTEEAETLTIADLFEYIYEQGYTNYALLVMHCIRENRAMWRVLEKTNSTMVLNFCKSLEFAERMSGLPNRRLIEQAERLDSCSGGDMDFDGELEQKELNEQV